MSRWLTAPVQKMCKTRLALAGKWGGLGASGLSGRGQCGPGVRRLHVGGQQTVLGQKCSQRDPAHARGHVGQELAAVEQVAAYEEPGPTKHGSSFPFKQSIEIHALRKHIPPIGGLEHTGRTLSGFKPGGVSGRIKSVGRFHWESERCGHRLRVLRVEKCKAAHLYSARRTPEGSLMSTVVEAPLEMVEAVAALRLPPRGDQRLQFLMDRNTNGELTAEEKEELEALVELSETISLLRAQALSVLGRKPT